MADQPHTVQSIARAGHAEYHTHGMLRISSVDPEDTNIDLPKYYRRLAQHNWENGSVSDREPWVAFAQTFIDFAIEGAVQREADEAAYHAYWKRVVELTPSPRGPNTFNLMASQTYWEAMSEDFKKPWMEACATVQALVLRYYHNGDD